MIGMASSSLPATTSILSFCVHLFVVGLSTCPFVVVILHFLFYHFSGNLPSLLIPNLFAQNSRQLLHHNEKNQNPLSLPQLFQYNKVMNESSE